MKTEDYQLIVIFVLICAVICVVSLWHSNAMMKKYTDYALKQPYEQRFFYSKEDFLRRIKSCNDPVAISNLKDQVEDFLDNNAQMIDEVFYTQAIADINGAIADKEKQFTTKR